VTERTIRADEVKIGQTVTDIEGERWKPRKKHGAWPTVVKAEYQERGEDGKPTVYLYLSDRPRASYQIAPDVIVTIEEV